MIALESAKLLKLSTGNERLSGEHSFVPNAPTILARTTAGLFYLACRSRNPFLARFARVRMSSIERLSPGTTSSSDARWHRRSNGNHRRLVLRSRFRRPDRNGLASTYTGRGCNSEHGRIDEGTVYLAGYLLAFLLAHFTEHASSFIGKDWIAAVGFVQTPRNESALS